MDNLQQFDFLRNADEITDNPCYGESFVNNLFYLLTKGRYNDACFKEVVECIQSIDEIRDEFADEIKTLIFNTARKNHSLTDVCDFLQSSAQFYTDTYSAKNRLRIVFESLISEQITVFTAKEYIRGN